MGLSWQGAVSSQDSSPPRSCWQAWIEWAGAGVKKCLLSPKTGVDKWCLLGYRFLNASAAQGQTWKRIHLRCRPGVGQRNSSPMTCFFCTKTWFSGHLKQAPQTKERYHLRVRPRKPQNILHFDLGQVGSQLLVGLRQKGLALLNFLCQPWVVAKKIDNLSGLARWISSLWSCHLIIVKKHIVASKPRPYFFAGLWSYS